MHPAIIQLGQQFVSSKISGSTARAVALMLALKRVITDYSTPEQKELARDLDVNLESCMEYLKKSRPISVSMSNAFRYLKRNVTALRTPNSTLSTGNVIPQQGYSDSEAKTHLLENIDKYISGRLVILLLNLHSVLIFQLIVSENVVLARQAICQEADKKIVAGDVILIYGFSALILETLKNSFDKEKKSFRVVVLDSSPRFEGLEMLRRLTKAQIPCGYMLISGASYIMSEVID